MIYFFICTRPFDKIIRSSFFHSFFLCVRPFDQKLGSSLIYLFYLYTIIRPKLGVTLTLKFIIFLILPIFRLQYCLYISSTIFIVVLPSYFVHHIYGRAAHIFRISRAMRSLSPIFIWLQMLITCALHIRSKGHREPRNGVGTLVPAERLVGFELGIFRFCLQCLNPLGHSPLVIYTLMNEMVRKLFLLSFLVIQCRKKAIAALIRAAE